jgi:hypothetical protein
MSPAKTIYVFRFGESGLYAFTSDPKGQVLPSQIYPCLRWRLERRLTIRVEKNSPNYKFVRSALDAIVKHGFHLAHAAFNMELLAFTAPHYKAVTLNAAS